MLISSQAADLRLGSLDSFVSVCVCVCVCVFIYTIHSHEI